MKRVVGVLERRAPPSPPPNRTVVGARLPRRGEPADDVRRAAARRERDRDVASAHERAHLALEHLLEGVVVGDARQRSRIGGQRLGGQRPPLALEAADELLAKWFASTELPPFPNV